METKKRVIIVGAGEAGRMLLREIQVHAADSYEIAGFIDDNPGLAERDVGGVPIVGRSDDIAALVPSLSVGEVLIAVPSAEREFVRRVVRQCRDANVPFRVVPGLLEIIKGPVHLEQLRDMRPEDLLGRESVEFDESTISEKLAGATVLVTGAGGSIGGEISRQIGRFGLGKLVLLGRGENQIYEIEHEMGLLHPGVATEVVIVDIRDRRALTRAFERISPDFVYHAAAHKHVHYMEAFPAEAVKNNVFGTRNVIEAAQSSRVRRVVMLSTDKAVNPIGIMGATKRFAEYLMMNGRRDEETPRLITVRFGNVLASRGSVVPLFVKQVRAGGPVTVSHQDASRFFMSLKEACMLVVEASLMGQGGEIYILRMGKPIRIVELAKDLIALHGLRPGIDVPITYSGLRPGEKMHEELVASSEETTTSAHPFILHSNSRIPEEFELAHALKELKRLCDEGDDEGVRRLLAHAIPESSL